VIAHQWVRGRFQKVPFQNCMMNQMINQKKMSNKMKQWLIMGKIKIKMERYLDPMTWLDEKWGTASWLCVSHSESIAELGWVVSDMSVKSSEGWNLMCWSMMLHNQSWSSISFIPHYSFHLSLPYTFLSLASPFPVTNIASFRTIKRVQKECPHHSHIKLPTRSSLW